MSCDSSEGVVVCRLPGADNKAPVWVRFSQPVEIVEAHSVDAVLPALEKISSATAAGLYAAGLISYEAAPTFDEANVTIPPNDAPPLLWFALYETPNEYWESASFAPRNPRKQKTEIATRDVDDFVAEFSRDDYLKSVETLLAYIREGDIYQANLTFRRISTNREATPFDLFLELMRAHPVPYGAFIDAGQFQIVSISPELFLLKTGNRLKTIPMKGTAARSPIPAKDAEIAAGLSLDEKNRAENLMILDMARNDLGRICLPGTIKANNLFQVETYASLHQMVSEVTGTLPDSTSLTDILQATFPAASITGAPKIRAMELIRELEKSPRGVYTGAIGCFEPNGDFLLNVAIRTITFSRSTMELGVGGGIVSDSSPEDEWNECLLKSHFITKRRVDFDLLETMLWKHHADHDPASAPLKNVEFLNEHLTRMRASADYFEFTFDETAISAKLAESIAEIPETAKLARIRLTLSSDGVPAVEASPIETAGWGGNPLTLTVSPDGIDSHDVFRHHKTTNRSFYDDRFKKARAEGFDEVIFLNEREEVTEGAISNLLILKNRVWSTPPLESGLLPGVLRAKLISELNAKEIVSTLEDLRSADELLICNSVRGAAKCALHTD